MQPRVPLAQNQSEDVALIRSRIREARQLFSQMDFDRARTVLESGLQLDPRQPELLHNMGSLYLMQSLMDESIGFYKKALANDPANVEAGMGLSKAFVATQRYEEAVEALQSIRIYLDKPGKQSEFFRLIGTIMSLRNEYAAALSFFKKYAEHAPELADPYHCLYTTYMQMKDEVHAQEVLTVLVDKFPKDRVAKIRQLDLWARHGNIRQLNPALDLLVREARNAPAACELAAQYYLTTHQLAYAARTAARLMRQTSSKLDAWPFLKRASSLIP